MLRKIVAVGGEPATGKTTLFQSVLATLQADAIAFTESYGKLRYMHLPALKLLVLGDYSNPNEVYAGTDRLSMAVQPDAVNFLYHANTQDEFENYTVLFEGDRLFNESFFAYLDSFLIDLKIFCLVVSKEERARRCSARGSKQNETFLKGRETKVANIVAARRVVQLPNQTELEGLENSRILTGEIL